MFVPAYASALNAAPAFRVLGTGSSGAGAVTPGLPTGTALNDILLMLVQSSNETISTPTNSVGGTWAEVTTQVGVGTAATAGSVRLGCYWMRAPGDSTTIGTVTVADTGNHTMAIIAGYTGCLTSGNPWNTTSVMSAVTTSTVNGNTNSVLTPDITTTVGNCMILMILAHAIDLSSSNQCNFTTLGLGHLDASPGITKRVDSAITQGTGGGWGMADDTLTAAGTVLVAATAPGCKLATATTNAIVMTLALTSN